MVEPVIVADPEIMSGTPCFRGTRVPFKNLIDYLEGGYSPGEFLRQGRFKLTNFSRFPDGQLIY